MLKFVVIDESFDWGDDKLLNIFNYESVIYEINFKGFIKLYFEILENLRGIYVGLVYFMAIVYF